MTRSDLVFLVAALFRAADLHSVNGTLTDERYVEDAKRLSHAVYGSSDALERAAFALRERYRLAGGE